MMQAILPEFADYPQHLHALLGLAAHAESTKIYVMFAPLVVTSKHAVLLSPASGSVLALTDILRSAPWTASRLASMCSPEPQARTSDAKTDASPS
jgi:hypothetical protein